MNGVLTATNLTSFDCVIPNEIGGMNAFEALLAAYRFKKSTLDTDLVARAYPKVWQTVRCLKDIPVVPASVADGASRQSVRSPFPPLSKHPKCKILMMVDGRCLKLQKTTSMQKT